MEGENGKKKRFDRDFKISAVKMVTEGGHKVSEVARSLGIDANQVYNWKKKLSDNGDKAFAHLDKAGAKSEITFGDLEEAIQSFDKIACKYITFLTSKGYVSLKPTIQNDWMRIFTVPFDIRKDAV